MRASPTRLGPTCGGIRATPGTRAQVGRSTACAPLDRRPTDSACNKNCLATGPWHCCGHARHRGGAALGQRVVPRGDPRQAGACARVGLHRHRQREGHAGGARREVRFRAGALLGALGARRCAANPARGAALAPLPRFVREAAPADGRGARAEDLPARPLQGGAGGRSLGLPGQREPDRRGPGRQGRRQAQLRAWLLHRGLRNRGPRASALPGGMERRRVRRVQAAPRLPRPHRRARAQVAGPAWQIAPPAILNRRMGRTGSADLPLHGGRVPDWLASRMARLGAVMVEALVLEEGPHGVLRRLAHPFWFQALGCVMGMDWHPSGITTSVLGALKRGLAGRESELGLTVCGGRGRHSRRTPEELIQFGERTGVDGAALARTSRLVAKVDSAAVQDGFALYLHGFVVANDGAWVVVQQGMNGARRQARRYHWLWDRAGAFVDEPHAAIEGRPVGDIVNLVDRRAAGARGEMVGLARGGPEAAVAGLARLRMPAHHDVRAEDIDLGRLGKTLAAVADRGPRDFAELMLVPGVGARTLFALALVAEVVHGAPSRFADPARFSLAHGGKDDHRFPVPLALYDQTISVLKRTVDKARLGRGEKLAAIRRLDDQARLVDSA